MSVIKRNGKSIWGSLNQQISVWNRTRHARSDFHFFFALPGFNKTMRIGQTGTTNYTQHLKIFERLQCQSVVNFVQF